MRAVLANVGVVIVFRSDVYFSPLNLVSGIFCVLESNLVSKAIGRTGFWLALLSSTSTFWERKKIPWLDVIAGGKSYGEKNPIDPSRFTRIPIHWNPIR